MKNNNNSKSLILKRARQHKLLENHNKCMLFCELPNDVQNHLFNSIQIEVHPVLVFFESLSTWTVLGEHHVFSKYSGILVSASYEEIHGKVMMVKPDQFDITSKKGVKFQFEFLLLEESNVKIWAPSGSEYFALMNILKAIK